MTSLLAPLLTLHIRIYMCVEFTPTDEFTLESKLYTIDSSSSTLRTTLYTLYTIVERGPCVTVEAHSQISVEAPLSTLCVQLANSRTRCTEWLDY